MDFKSDLSRFDIANVEQLKGKPKGTISLLHYSFIFLTSVSVRDPEAETAEKIRILSPHTSAKDRCQKFEVYETSKVNEYWVADPFVGTMLAYKLNAEGKYKGHLKPFV